jgi:hypothetical protein
MFIIHRLNDDLVSTEFQAIRQAYWNDAALNTAMSLGNWLRSKGVEAITNIPESIESDDYDDWLEEYKVLEVRFPSEHAYLAFKLKYM